MLLPIFLDGATPWKAYAPAHVSMAATRGQVESGISFIIVP